MMNLKQTWKLAALSLAAIATINGCANDEFDDVSSKGQTVITAGFEQPGAKTRTAVNASNEVVWVKNDAFKLFFTPQGGTQQDSEFKTSDDSRQTSASFTGTALPAGATASYAVYPSANVVSLSDGDLTMNLPSSFDASEASNGPMFANASSDYTSLSFKHLCGLLKLTVTNLPTTATKLVVSANKAIAGRAIASLSSAGPVLAVDSEGSTSITVTSINVALNGTQQTFYIPLPVGTYTNLTAKITNDNDVTIEKYKDKVWPSATVTRAGMLYATFGFDIETDASTDDISSIIAANAPQTAPAEESNTTVLVKGQVDATTSTNQEINVPVVKNSNISLTFDQVPNTTSTNPLLITDNTTTSGAGTSSETSTNVTTIAIPQITEEASAPSLTITTPNSTTELAAANEENGTKYNIVTALTAKNTLVIKKNVEVEEIKVLGGNIRINSGAKVTTITKSWTGEGKCIVYVETGATYPNNLSTTDFDVQYTDMAGILKNGGTLTLDEDIELTVPMVVEGDVTLDLNGHKISATTLTAPTGLISDDALVIVRRGGKLTINDTKGTGSIDGTGWSGDHCAVKLTDKNDETNESIKTKTATLVVNGGTLKGLQAGISGNGNRHGTEITINGGHILSTNEALGSNDGVGIYHPQDGTLTISGGLIEGYQSGVEIRSGKLIMTNGTLKSNATTYTDSPNGNGTTMSGTALAVSQHNTEKDIIVTIEGGTFEGPYALSEKDLQNKTGNVTLSVTGGTFKGQVASIHGSDGFIKGGKFNDVKAINYAADGGSLFITLNDNVEIKEAVRLNQNAQVDLDLNGHDVVNKTTVNGNETYVFYASKGTMTIHGNGNVKSLGGESSVDGYRIAVFADGTATFNLQGGSYYNHQSINAQLDLIYAKDHGKIYISGGTYESGCYGTYTKGETYYKHWVLNKLNKDKANTVIEVTGGTFKNFNPAKPNTDDNETYLASDYVVKCNGTEATEAHTTLETKEYVVERAE